MEEHSDPALGAEEIASFVRDGFIRLDNAFPGNVAADARNILWKATGCDPDDRSTWSRPVIRLDRFDQPPFQDAASAPRVTAAINQLVGEGRWRHLGGLGTFPVRFPSPQPPGDDGWHIDASFGYEDPDFMEWRVNLASRGRCLLALFLFSDVGADDAPTRIRIGSHIDIARQLEPAGEAGMTLRELASDGFAGSAHRPEVLATGPAGTVYLCHPFLVHSAQEHRGRNPRFMAQQAILPTTPLVLDRPDGAYSPVEQAILAAIEKPT